MEPNMVLVVSGKRKSGKDFICEKLVERLNKDCVVQIITLSAPLKQAYAIENNLDYSKLLDSSSYKELYRSQMIKFGQEKRSKDPWYFCKLATTQLSAISTDEPKKALVWIVSDARYPTDISYFRDVYKNKVKLVRVVANDNVRASRGWIHVDGIDNAPSECSLDEIINWEFCIENNNNQNELHDCLSRLIEHAYKFLFLE